MSGMALTRILHISGIFSYTSNQNVQTEMHTDGIILQSPDAAAVGAGIRGIIQKGKHHDKLQAAIPCLLDKFLNVLQPLDVLLLLLVVDIIGNEQRHPGVDAALFKVFL